MAAGDESLVFVVHRMEIDYKSPARMDDILTIRTSTEKAAGAKLILDQEIRRDGVALIAARVIVAVINPRGRPQRLPVELTEKFSHPLG
jgi:acyl-CoA thioester hydrolase